MDTYGTNTYGTNTYGTNTGTNTDTSWFGSLKKKLTSLYDTAKGTQPTPIIQTTGGSKRKRRRHRKSKRKVRFSKKNKIYTVRRYKK
jgi:hypothetical protein